MAGPRANSNNWEDSRDDGQWYCCVDGRVRGYGSTAGAGGAAAACLAFGVATGGWGLLACAAVGGIGGGLTGTYAGNQLYYPANPAIDEKARETGLIEATDTSCRICGLRCVWRRSALTGAFLVAMAPIRNGRNA
jgi:hypothetical protein